MYQWVLQVDVRTEKLFANEWVFHIKPLKVSHFSQSKKQPSFRIPLFWLVSNGNPGGEPKSMWVPQKTTRVRATELRLMVEKQQLSCFPHRCSVDGGRVVHVLGVSRPREGVT